jgi:hypothetical protein
MIRFQYRTYDVWGNTDDGWEVNDVFNEGIVELDDDSDETLRHEFGEDIEIEENDIHIYINRADGYPIGELIREEQS